MHKLFLLLAFATVNAAMREEPDPEPTVLPRRRRGREDSPTRPRLLDRPQNNDDEPRVLARVAGAGGEALELVREVVGGYVSGAASVAGEIAKTDVRAAAKFCAGAICIPVFLGAVVWFACHEQMYGKYDWELEGDARRAVCDHFVSITQDIPMPDTRLENKYNVHDMVHMCEKGWLHDYQKSEWFLDWCYGTDWGWYPCPNTRMVTDREKNADRTTLLRTKQYDRGEILDLVKIQLDHLVHQKNEQFKKPETRQQENLRQVEEAKIRANRRYKDCHMLAQREANKPKHLKRSCGLAKPFFKK